MVLLLRDNRAKGHPGLIIMLEMVVTMMMVLMLFMLMLVAKFEQSGFVMMICSSPLIHDDYKAHDIQVVGMFMPSALISIISG